MMSIDQVVSQVVATPAPVLFLDTCVLFDLVRMPIREEEPKVAQRRLNAAQNLTTLLASSKVWVLVAEQVILEWDRNCPSVEDELKRHWTRLDQTIAIASEVAKLAGVSAEPTYAYGQNPLHQSLKILAKMYLDHGVTVQSDDRCKSRAMERTLQLIPPAKNGKGLGDCIIIEHCLEITGKLRSANFQEVCVFFSSNVQDFCEGRARLKEPLDKEFQGINLNFANAWDSARANLLK